MRVALYARVSKDDGKQDTENQLHALREFCQRSEYTIEFEYVDRVSGGKSERPQFKRMMADAGKRKFDLVLFWSLDRFSREGVVETLNYLKTLDSYRVGWKSYTETYFDGCGFLKDAIIGIMAALAKQERIKISDRTMAGLKRARREGKTLGRPHVDVDVDKVRKLNEGGMSLRAIAEKTDWSLSSIMRALREEKAKAA